MGLCHRLVHGCGRYDSYLWWFPIQYGLVWFYLSYWLVLSHSHPNTMTELIMSYTGVFTLLTIAIGEELESRFLKVTSCVSSLFHPSDQVEPF
jgi:hypothetical protein